MRLAWLAAASCVSSLPAASLVGVPDAPTAWAQPAAWFGVGNDSFGGGFGDDDDFRTAALRGGWHAGRFDGAVDYSILTNRGLSSGIRRGRSDELTLSAGYRLVDLGGCRDPLRLRLSTGGGGRIDGDLGGSQLQNADHRLFGYRQVSLPYERHRDLDGLAYAHGDLLATPDLRVPDCALLPDFNGQWALRLDAAALATAGGDRRECAGARLELLGCQAEGWIGCEWRWSQGVDPSRTAAAVDEREDGPWIVTGTSAALSRHTAVAIDGGLDPATREAMATLALLYGTESAKCPESENGSLSEELGYQRGGPIVRVRWHPEWIDALVPSAVAIDPFLDYRFGHAEDQTVLGSRVAVAQWTAGYQLGLPLALARWVIGPTVEGCVGLRREAVDIGVAGRSHDERSLRPVVQGGLGLSAVCDGSVGLCATLDRWLPIGGPVEIPGAGGATYQHAGWSPGGRLILVESF